MIQCRRAYDPPTPADGQRVLVDRLWPRNCRKESLMLNEWRREVAPSTPLRRAFKGGEVDFATFRQRYRSELAAHPEHWWALLEPAQNGVLTLVYAARDEQQNNAQVLAEWLEEALERQAEPNSPTCLAGKT